MFYPIIKMKILYERWGDPNTKRKHWPDLPNTLQFIICDNEHYKKIMYCDVNTAVKERKHLFTEKHKEQVRNILFWLK